MIDPRKFRDPNVTADGSRRARVALASVETLWINTGTLCNLTCRNCYIESSPRNDRVVYISAAVVAEYPDEIEREGLGTREIGFTGGDRQSLRGSSPGHPEAGAHENIDSFLG